MARTDIRVWSSQPAAVTYSDAVFDPDGTATFHPAAWRDTDVIANHLQVMALLDENIRTPSQGPADVSQDGADHPDDYERHGLGYSAHRQGESPPTEADPSSL